MDNETNSCACGDDCCSTKKKKPNWMMLLSVLILLAALSIIFLKVFNKPPAIQNAGNATTVQASCCDTSKQDSCAKPCAPKQ